MDPSGAIDDRWFAGRPCGLAESLDVAGAPLEAWLVPSDAGGRYLVIAHGGVDAATTDAGRAAVVALLDGARFAPVVRTRPLGREQTNTSFVAVLADGAQLLVKILRRQDGGPNPDVEIPQRLAAMGSHVVVGPVATWSQAGCDLAVATPFLALARDAWEVALGAGDPRELALGVAAMVAELHLDLAEAFGVEEAHPGEHAEALHRAERALGQEVPAHLVAAAAGMVDPGVVLRTHGDLHLGQVLEDRGRWLAIDFEGEPDRPLADRVRTASPVRDLAGMVRSFSYAEAVGKHPTGWAALATDVFLVTYLGRSEVARLLPSDVDAALMAHLVEKAAYELAYERSHRPDWAWIPERALADLIGA